MFPGEQFYIGKDACLVYPFVYIHRNSCKGIVFLKGRSLHSACPSCEGSVSRCRKRYMFADSFFLSIRNNAKHIWSKGGKEIMPCVCSSRPTF